MHKEPAERTPNAPLDDPRDFPPGSVGSNCPKQPEKEFMTALHSVDKTFTTGRVGIGSFDNPGYFDEVTLRGKRVQP